jgi:hypothetical protein
MGCEARRSKERGSTLARDANAAKKTASKTKAGLWRLGASDRHLKTMKKKSNSKIIITFFFALSLSSEEFSHGRVGVEVVLLDVLDDAVRHEVLDRQTTTQHLSVPYTGRRCENTQRLKEATTTNNNNKPDPGGADVVGNPRRHKVNVVLPIQKARISRHGEFRLLKWIP